MVGTFHRRYENTFALMHRLFVDSTRKPDEAWLMCEDEEDEAAIYEALAELDDLELLSDEEPWHVMVVPTPRDTSGECAVIPYSNKINTALDLIDAAAVVYLDNGSMPGPDKYRVMAEGLENNPEWGAVYCTQKRSGYIDELFTADEIIEAAAHRLNYTQVMHRPTGDRWPLELSYAQPDIADSVFWGKLNETLGPFYPVGGTRILDDHHMPTANVEL